MSTATNQKNVPNNKQKQVRKSHSETQPPKPSILVISNIKRRSLGSSSIKSQSPTNHQV